MLDPHNAHEPAQIAQEGGALDCTISRDLAARKPLLGSVDLDIIKVSAQSRSTSVAGAIAGVVREHGRAELQAIGAGAVNQAVKAVIIARSYLALYGIDIICIPVFTEVFMEGKERTAIRLVVEPR